MAVNSVHATTQSVYCMTVKSADAAVKGMCPVNKLAVKVGVVNSINAAQLAVEAVQLSR